MKNEYMTVETTNMYGSVCYSLQSTADIQNGAIVGKGDLITGETSVYSALDDYSNGMYLVANPAWSYDDSLAENQNEENYINKAGVAFRVYRLYKDMKFKIGNVKDADFAKGDYVKYTGGKYVKSTDATALKVVNVENVGFPYCIGSYGETINGDTANEYGQAIDTRTTKYTIEVVPVDNTVADTTKG